MAPRYKRLLANMQARNSNMTHLLLYCLSAANRVLVLKRRYVHISYMPYDIVIAGAGLAGSIAALLLAKGGRRVALVDPRSDFEPGVVQDDGRSTAVMPLGLSLLERAGMGAVLEKSQPLVRLRLIDACQGQAQVLTFDAKEISEPYFGLNIDNTLLRRAVFSALKTHDLLDLFPAQKAVQAKEGQLLLADGHKLDAKLVIAADGKNSALRQAAGIKTKTRDLDQSAFTFRIRHTLPHHDTSTEFFEPGGPLTLIPLSDGQTSAVVWSHSKAEATALEAASEQDFLAQLQRKTRGILGKIELISKPFCVPIRTVLAEKLTASRLVILAEAAHALPAFGAQGLNTSLADVHGLTSLLEGVDDVGASDILRQYCFKRGPDTKARYEITLGLSRVLPAEQFFAVKLKNLGFKVLRNGKLPRKFLMQTGMRPVRI